MSDRADDVVYFTSPKGLVGLSCDGGLTITLPSGKTMKPTSAWLESSEDLLARLSSTQRAIVEKFLEIPPRTEMEEIVHKLRKSTNAAARYRPPPEPEHPDVPLDSLVVESDPLD